MGRKEKEKYLDVEWEQKREIVKERLRKLPEYVREAVSVINVQKRVSRPEKVDLEKRIMPFLFAKLVDKSNMLKNFLSYLSPCSGIKVSHKTVERLYR